MKFDLPQVVEVGQVWEVKTGYFVDELAPRNKVIVSKIDCPDGLAHRWVNVLDMIGQKHYIHLDKFKEHYRRIA